MKLIPAISLRDGHIVVVEKGRYSSLRNEAGQYRNPLNVIKGLKSQATEIFVMDIDGVERNSPNLTTVKRMAGLRDVWLDAGTADADSMMDLFISDASRVVMGTAYLDSLTELKEALDMSENIIVSVGYDKGVLSPDKEVRSMGIDALLEEIRSMPNASAGMLFDLGGLRDKTKPEMDVVGKMAEAFGELYVSGHIEPEILGALESAGVTGVIQDFRSMEAMRDV